MKLVLQSLSFRRRIPLAILTGALLLGAKPVARALDFQIHEFESEFDGMPRQQQYFQNDAQTRILIDLPNNWEKVGEPASLKMTQAKLVGCEIQLQKSPLSTQIAFQDKGLDAYRQAALASVPSGAVNAQITASTDNAYPLHEWKTYEFVVKYEFFGQVFQRSALFVNVNAREQMLVSTVAPLPLYERVHTEATELLRSWRVVPIKQTN